MRSQRFPISLTDLLKVVSKIAADHIWFDRSNIEPTYLEAAKTLINHEETMNQGVEEQAKE